MVASPSSADYTWLKRSVGVDSRLPIILTVSLFFAFRFPLFLPDQIFVYATLLKMIPAVINSH